MYSNESTNDGYVSYRCEVSVLGLRDVVAGEEDHTEGNCGEEPEEGVVTHDGLEVGHERRGDHELQVVQAQGEAAPHTPGLQLWISVTISEKSKPLRQMELSGLLRCRML